MKKSEAETLVEATGLSPIFNEQTPAVSGGEWLSPQTLKLCADIAIFAKFNRFSILAGLAANQLAKDGKRLDLDACFIKHGNGSWLVAFHPVIVELQGVSFTSIERCMTWPRKEIRAIRNERAIISFWTGDNKAATIEVAGFGALVWQHEINHLRGVAETVYDPMMKWAKPNAPCQCKSGRKFKHCCGR